MTHPMQALSGCCELLYGLDADDRRDVRHLELAPCVTEELLRGNNVGPATELVRAGDREALTSHGE